MLKENIKDEKPRSLVISHVHTLFNIMSTQTRLSHHQCVSSNNEINIYESVVFHLYLITSL